MWVLLVIAAGIALFVLVPVAATFYTDYLWFESIGQAAVFTTAVTSQITLFALGTGVFLALTMLSLSIARTVARRLGEVPAGKEGVLTYIARIQARAADRTVTFGALAVAVALAIIMGLVVSSRWLLFLRYVRAQPFGVRDPLFGLDVGVFVFELPVYRFLQGWLLAALVLIAGLTGAYYVFRTYGFTVQGSDLATLASARGVRIHFFTLASLLALLLAVGYRFDAYNLVYAHRGVVHGAGYADRFAELPALTILTVVAGLLAVALFANGFRRGFALAGIALVFWLLVAVVVGGIYPALVQQFQVQPSELDRETPYLKDNIEMTRRAFNLAAIEAKPFPGEPEPKPGVVERNPQTFDSIRLWDHRPLLATYNQIQTIRTYYDFNDVDIDRYHIDGTYRQVMLSARELSPGKLAGQAQTWVNQRLTYTHGYGLAMSPVNEVTSQGLPDFLIKDVPPTGKIPVTRPEIYYGETTNSYVIVDTTAPEFDYPQGDANVYHAYSGRGGVALDSFLKKVAFAVANQDLNLLLTSYLTPSSRILYNRQITERLRRVAPFLNQDSDPYLVVANGRLYWIQDAYTVTDAYPYSTPYHDAFNYIRNSVKVVTDAYDGRMHLYVSDPSDPLIRSYRQIFPGLFEPIEKMDELSPELRAHLRYPEGIFLVQADVLRAYHMQDPRVFYNREDLWDLPIEIGPDGRQLMQPYYVIMRLPGQDAEEFVLMLPFTPAGKTNMVAWLAAESDGASYGKMIVLTYPKDTVVYGPQQVEALIDQDARISQLLSLWNQQGSRVIRGNLLVLPIENSTLYVEPLYLQANQSQIPELKRVILATQRRLVIGSTLSESLDLLFGSGKSSGTSETSPIDEATAATPTPTPTGERGQPPTATPAAGVATPAAGSVNALARSADAHYQRAQEALKNGDWATYGAEIQAMEADVQKILQATRP